VASLREDGHDVLYVLERKTGVSDDEILLEAYNEERILVTEDKDFGELVYRFKKPSKGIILIRMDVKERHMKWLRLKKLIENYEERLPGHLVVIDNHKFRFRPLLFPL
jgi:predicted nuclease of predicted toxin-antitoxin system